MKLNEISRADFEHDDTIWCSYKSWDVSISFNGAYYSLSIFAMLEEDSDAIHSLISKSTCSTLSEVREEVKLEVGGYTHTAKEIINLHSKGHNMDNATTSKTVSQLLAA